MMIRKSYILNILFCVAALGLASCGDGKKTTSSSAGADDGDEATRTALDGPTAPNLGTEEDGANSGGGLIPGAVSPDVGRAMLLQVDRKVIYDKATDEDISKAVRSVIANGVIILKKKEDIYLRADGNISHGFELEYQEGEEKHLRSVERNLGKDEVTIILQKYNQGDPSWMAGAEWRKLNF